MVDVLQSSLQSKEHYDNEETWDKQFVQNPCVLTEMTEEEFEQWLIFQSTMHEPTVGGSDVEDQVDAHANRSQQRPNGGSECDDDGKQCDLKSRGIDGLATACESPPHEHIVHEAYLLH